jgi:hypothetical protein
MSWIDPGPTNANKKYGKARNAGTLMPTDFNVADISPDGKDNRTVVKGLQPHDSNLSNILAMELELVGNSDGRENRRVFPDGSGLPKRKIKATNDKKVRARHTSPTFQQSASSNFQSHIQPEASVFSNIG